MRVRASMGLAAAVALALGAGYLTGGWLASRSTSLAEEPAAWDLDELAELQATHRAGVAAGRRRSESGSTSLIVEVTAPGFDGAPAAEVVSAAGSERSWRIAFPEAAGVPGVVQQVTLAGPDLLSIRTEVGGR